MKINQNKIIKTIVLFSGILGLAMMINIFTFYLVKILNNQHFLVPPEISITLKSIILSCLILFTIYLIERAIKNRKNDKL